VLDALVERDGLTPGEIATRLEVSGPTAVKMTQRMEANGLVERRRDDPDGRLVRVYLTEKGREIQEPIQREIDRVAGRALAGLGTRSRETLRRSLETVRGNLAGGHVAGTERHTSRLLEPSDRVSVSEQIESVGGSVTRPPWAIVLRLSW
jgi:DNA-binding MarR family transcriptional regulator